MRVLQLIDRAFSSSVWGREGEVCFNRSGVGAAMRRGKARSKVKEERPWQRAQNTASLGDDVSSTFTCYRVVSRARWPAANTQLGRVLGYPW